jgi:hypothetical protein
LQTQVKVAKPPGLANANTMSSILMPGNVTGKTEIRPISPGTPSGVWVQFQPPNLHFSILAPGDAIQATAPVTMSTGKVVQIQYIIGTIGGTVYSLMWTKGPSDAPTAAGTADLMVKAVVEGLNHVLQNGSLGATMSAKPQREVSVTGYAGTEYSLSGGLSGVVRVLSKQIGDEREVFTLVVLNKGQAADERFLSSFKVRVGQ